MWKRLVRARGYIVSGAVAAAVAICFNNCAQSGLPPGLDGKSTQSSVSIAPDLNASALAVFPASTNSEPYVPVSFAISGGTAPYQISGDFSGTLAQAGSMPFAGYFPGAYNATVTDATGAQQTFKINVTGALAPAIAVAYTMTTPTGVSTLNYYYTTELEQSNKFPTTDVAAGFPIYAGVVPAHTHTVYICDNGAARQFLSPDSACEGHPKLASLGNLYDSADAIPGFTLKALYRFYNSASTLHRALAADAAVPDGFVRDSLLGYMAPKRPTQWCGKWTSCP